MTLQNDDMIDIDEQRCDVQNDGKLWVDKYTSHKFFELLTDEAINRKVMTWVRSWDEHTFPERAHENLKPPDDSLALPGRKFGPQKAFFQNRNANLVEQYSKAAKPILMLFGAPGTGKSTMARVVAKICGYQTREVNASDVRSGEQLVEKIRNCLTTDAHFGKAGFLGPLVKTKRNNDWGAENGEKDRKQPICLILDEVDGALGGGSDQSRGMAQVA